MQRKTVVVACVLFLFVLGTHGLFAQVPHLINYQGYLTDSAGNPITGNRSIEFRIYNVATGGTSIWDETQSVTVTTGLFSVLLGSATSIPYHIFGGGDKYLALKVGTDSQMTPRKQLVSVGYAFLADDADHLGGHAASDYIRTIDTVPPAGSGNVDLIAGSNVTITPNPGAHTVTIAASGGGTGDNLGNHTATQNIKLNGNWLSNDGGSEGISVSNGGAVSASNYFDTGSPSQAHGAGDICATDDVIADGQVRGYGAGSVNYSVLGINGGIKGYLASSSRGAHGEYSSSRYGYFGTSAYGGYAQYSSSIYARLGASNAGMWAYNGTKYGVCAYSSRGVEGYYSGTRWGYIGSSTHGAYFIGPVHVSGTLSKSAGSFKIDHPLDPENKYLQHSFVESPDMMNIYNGNIVLDSKGEATVELPAYFEALNIDFRYQLTAIGAPGPNLYVAEEISNNRFRIAGGSPAMKVSWNVTGVRNDAYAKANRIKVEVDKEGDENGKYEHAEAFGLSEERSIHYSMPAGFDKAEQQRLIEKERKEMNEFSSETNEK